MKIVLISWKGSQGLPGVLFMGYTFENCWFNLRPDIKDLKNSHRRSLTFHLKINQNKHTHTHTSLDQTVPLSALIGASDHHVPMAKFKTIYAKAKVKSYSFLAHESYKT